MSYIYLLAILLCVYSGTNCERLHEQIYSSLEGGAACFRRLNGTHQVGCSSSDKGAVGVVHMIEDITDVQWLILNATAGPYMAIVSTSLFYDVVELFMKYPGNIAGILLYDNATNSAKSFTQESRCPNEYSSSEGSQCSSSQAGGVVWNEKGTGLLQRDIPFPIFYLPQSQFEEISKIEQCYKKYNLDWNNQKGKPLCSVQLNSFMFAAVNSEVCLRRSATSSFATSTKVCDPLGDTNVYYSLFPRSKNDISKKKDITLVTARIDTASLFDGKNVLYRQPSKLEVLNYQGSYPGAASSVVGMVTLITAAATLAKLIPTTDSNLYDQNVLWTLFNGEAFDYIGSQRVAYDLSIGAWPPAAPLSPADIRLHFEIGQIGGSLSNEKAWPFHAFAPYDNVVPEVTEFLVEMSSYASLYNMTISPEFSTNLPPSSLHSFRRILSNVTTSESLRQVVLVDHKETFTNMFYQSTLDDYDKIGFIYHNISIDNNGTFLSTDELIANGNMTENELQVKMARLATALVRSLYKTVVGEVYAGNVTASAHLVDEMLYCFLRSQSCRLLAAANYAARGGDEPVPGSAAPLYVGVAGRAAAAPVFAGHLLALLAGRALPAARDNCTASSDPGFSNYWLNGWNNSGVCIQTTMNFSDAISPAFILSGYDMRSSVYSTWTESVWQTMSARVFVSAGGYGARAALLAGLFATAVAVLVTFWLQKHRRLLFPPPVPSVLRDDAASGILRTVNC